MTRPGTHSIAFDDRLEPAERLLIAVFYQAAQDIKGKVKKHRLGAELFFAGCGFDPQRVVEAHK